MAPSPLTLAAEVGRRAIAEGFEWPQYDDSWHVIRNEYAEFEAACHEGLGQEAMAHEIGDVIFSIVKLALRHGVDAETALNTINRHPLHSTPLAASASALHRARAIAKQAPWAESSPVLAHALAQYDAFYDVRYAHAPAGQMADKIGMLLFSAVEVAYHHGIDPVDGLLTATREFVRRYRYLEQHTGKPLREQPFKTLFEFWQVSKNELTGNG